MNPEFRIRKPVADDVEYILKTWLREAHVAQPQRLQERARALAGNEHASVEWTAAWPGRLFFPDYQAEVIVPCMQRNDARIICPTADVNIIESVVLGRYAPPVDPDGAGCMVVHFAFTRPAFRRLGLARAALQDMGWREGQDELVASWWSKYLNRFTRRDLLLNPLTLWKVR